MIGAAALLLLAFNGKIMGVSGITRSVIFEKAERHWKLAFLLGLLLGVWLFQWFFPMTLPFREQISLPVIIAAGLLVGLGTRIGSGCTSGHGVCGIGRMSKRSIVATCVFMVSAIATVFVFNSVTGA